MHIGCGQRPRGSIVSTPRAPIRRWTIDELAREQAYIDAAYERLHALRALAQRLAGEAHWRDEDYVVDSLFERDVVAAQAAHRLASLDVPKGRMAIGRLDLHDGERRYIGRLAIAGADGEPLIIDWRAPVAEAFYRAVPSDPMGVVRRRHLRWRWDELVGLDDELFDAERAVSTGLGLVGEGALLAALAAPRTGRMTDVVATIQAEQDRVMRRPKPGVLVVQGAPGTGKTAVALHRAAYLLYAERDSFHQHGILFVGPNQTFLRYVEEVVPSLGEDRVVLASPSELGPEVTVDRDEAPAVVRLKGDARMVAVLEQAVADRERAGKDGASIPCGRFTLTLGNDVLRQVAARGRKAKGTHNARRASVERALLAALQRELDAAEARDVKLGRIAVADERKILDVVDRAAVAAIANRLWPILTPETLLTSLYASPRRCARAGRGVLHEEEITLLVREKDDLGWSEADVALLDELATLLGPLPEPRRPRRSAPVDPMIERVLADLIPDCPVCGSELTYISRGSQPQDDRFRCDRCLPVRYFHTYTVMGDMAAQHLRGVHDSLVSRNTGTTTSAFRTGDVRYGHVVVDEAQDLSAMQWRAIARRCPSRSMTIAGDQGQAIRAGGTGTWDAAVAAVGAGSYDLAELTVNYRTPAEVMVAAEAVLTAAGVGFSRTRSVRSTQRPVAIVVDAIDASAVQRALDTIEVEGTRAVIAPLARLDELGALGCQVLDVREAKGLEFDAVVVVEPEVIVDEGEGGARRLYVALTRTTNQLRVVTATTDGLIGALLEHCEPAPI